MRHPGRAPRRLRLLCIVVVALSACTAGTSTSSPPGPTPPPTSSAGQPAGSAEAPAANGAPDADLRVMTFNIEYGGEGVAFSSVAKAVEAANADVVAVNEGYGNIARIAAALGWDYYDTRSQIVSRLPLLTPPGSDDTAFDASSRTTDGRAVMVEVSPGRVAAVVNVHLPSTSYSPFAVQKGATAREVVSTERRVRLPALRRPLRTARGLIADDVPVFVLGDFNAPSDRDWTAAAVGLRDQVRFPVRWPTSAAAEASGLVDSYRSVHPDPVADQGLTWPADRPFVRGYNPARGGQAADRIDLLFSGGPARATGSSIVGERGSDADVVVSPWPSDHRAVVSEFELTAAAAPTLVSVRSRLVERGRRLAADYVAAGRDAATLEVSAQDGSAAAAGRLPDAATGTVRVDTADLTPGAYTAHLLDAGGGELAAMNFWVEPPGAEPVLRTGRHTYPRGRSIAVSWERAPGNRNDWLAVYRRGGRPSTASYLGWTYTGAQVTGSTRLAGRTHGMHWPLPAGRYTAYLLADDSYDVLARTDFSVD